MSPGADNKDSSARLHFGNHNQTLESPKISTRRHQTPDEGIGTLSAECATQEVLKKNQDGRFVLTVSEASSQWQDRREPNTCGTLTWRTLIN